MMAIIKLFILCAVVWCFDVTGMTIDQVLEAASNASGVGVQRSDSQGGDVVTVELDMKYTREEYQALRNSRHTRGKRQAVRLETRKWTNKTVPYKMSFITFNSEEMQAIRNTIDEAMDEWSNYTCINFRPATRGDDNYVVFRDGDSCSSYVGMKTGIQDIELLRTCSRKQIVIHEIGHALGLHHHHMRPDRDDYVTINKSNIRQGFLSEFEKNKEHEVTTYGEPYDYLSVMHYGSKFFSYNKRPTMIAKDERFKDLIGNSPGASFSDIKLVNYMYHCNENCPPKSCPGKGFVGKDCDCWCPGNVTEHAAGRPVVKCTDASIEPCLIPGDPDYKSNNCLYQYTKSVETRQIKAENLLQEQLQTVQEQLRNLSVSIEAMKSSPVSNIHRDCEDLYKSGSRRDGVYNIYPSTLSSPVQVYCDMSRDGGGWTVIQRRDLGNVKFNRSWAEYKTGFGSLNGEFWLGNEYISAITNQNRYSLRIYLQDWDEDTRYAVYDTFRVQSEADNYKLGISGYSGNARDSMKYHNGHQFTTYDQDHDTGSGNCAQRRGGGWWFYDCDACNLNGPYQASFRVPRSEIGVIWHYWRGSSYSLKSTIMKIRPFAF